MKDKIAKQLPDILGGYDPMFPQDTAARLRELWLQFEPKSVGGIKAELRAQQETAGIPVPVLRTIGREISRLALQRVDDFLPLTRVLWDEFGREGRVVGLIPLGAMELVDPQRVVPLLKQMCRSCVTWEDADRLAMDALEQIVRKKPGEWLDAMGAWLMDENMWVRRAGVIVVGRLPMKHPQFTTRCLELLEERLKDEEVEVKKAVSFAIRLCARGAMNPVREFLGRHVPPEDPAATWVLCDVIRSMTKSFLPEFRPLLPSFEAWAADPTLSARDRRSVESVTKKLSQSLG